MARSPLTPAAAVYRLVTLRRLTLLGIILIALGAWAAQALSGGQTYGPGWGGSLFVVGLCVALLVWHNLVFPAGWIEALSLPLAAMTCQIALGGLLATGVIPGAVIGLIMMVLFPCTVGAIASLIGASFDKIPKGEITRTARVHLDVSAAEFMGWEHLCAGETTGLRRAGEENADGLVPVWNDFDYPTEENGFAANAPGQSPDRAPDYYVRLIEQGPFHKISQSIMPGTDHNGEPRMSLCHLTVTQTGPQSCLITEREVHNLYNFHMWAVAWLCDQSRDYFREARDAIRGVPSLAIPTLPQNTLLATLARCLIEQELAEPL